MPHAARPAHDHGLAVHDLAARRPRGTRPRTWRSRGSARGRRPDAGAGPPRCRSDESPRAPGGSAPCARGLGAAARRPRAGCPGRRRSRAGRSQLNPVPFRTRLRLVEWSRPKCRDLGTRPGTPRRLRSVVAAHRIRAPMSSVALRLHVIGALRATRSSLGFGPTAGFRGVLPSPLIDGLSPST